MGELPDFKWAYIIGIVLCGVSGWAVISAIVWLVGKVSVTWGGLL